MVCYCCAVDCKSKCIKGNGITFHRFPLKNEELLRKWVQAVRRADWQPTKHSVLCSEHFNEDDFYPCQSKRNLREDVVPTRFAHRPTVEKRPAPKLCESLEVRSLSDDVIIIEVENVYDV